MQHRVSRMCIRRFREGYADTAKRPELNQAATPALGGEYHVSGHARQLALWQGCHGPGRAVGVETGKPGNEKAGLK